MTLIEVLAGLVVLGTILVAILTIRARYTRQLLLADQRQEAIALTDELIAGWMDGGGHVPIMQSGRLGQAMIWRTAIVPDRAARELASEIVRVEVMQAEELEGGADVDVILAIDLLVPGERPPVPPEEAATQPAEPATQPTTRPIDLYEDPRLREGLVQ